jgi:hypothetical protein
VIFTISDRPAGLTARRRSPEAAAVLDWRGGPRAVGGDEGIAMASKANLNRETLRVIQAAGPLEEARI